MLNYDDLEAGPRGLVDYLGRNLATGDMVLYPTFSEGHPEVGIVVSPDAGDKETPLEVRRELGLRNGYWHGEVVRHFGGPVVRIDGVREPSEEPQVGDVVVRICESLWDKYGGRPSVVDISKMFWVVADRSASGELFLKTFMTGHPLDAPVLPGKVLIIGGIEPRVFMGKP